MWCSLASAFSQVPLYLRQTVQSVTSVPQSQTSAYTAAQQITIFSSKPVDADVLVHESAHAQVAPSFCQPLSMLQTCKRTSAASILLCTAVEQLVRPKHLLMQDKGFSSSAEWNQVAYCYLTLPQRADASNCHQGTRLLTDLASKTWTESRATMQVAHCQRS